MYQDPRYIKNNLIKTKVDDFAFKEFEQIVNLNIGKQPATVARMIIEMGMSAWHEKNSINLGQKQKELSL